MPLSGDHEVGDPDFVAWANLVDSTIGAVQASVTSEATARAAADAGKQPLDADLTAIAALDSATAGALVTDGAGWIRKSYAQLKAALGLVAADVSDFSAAALSATAGAYGALDGPNAWTGTQDFTGATVTGIEGGGGSSVSLTEKGAWATATAYVVGDVVTQSGIRYIVKTAHTSGTFLTDLGAGRLTALSLSNAVTAIGLQRDFSAVGDCRILTDPVVTATTTLTSATGAFTAGDVGKTVAIPYAGTSRTSHVTTVASVESGTSLTLTAAPANAVTASRTVTDAAIMKNASNLSSATASWTSADIGKKISIPGAGFLRSDATLPLETKIVSVTSSTVVVVAHTATTTVSAQTVTIPGPRAYIGTNDTTALQSAAALGQSTGRPVEVEPGNYLITGQIEVASKHAWWGHGAGVSVVTIAGNTAPLSAFVNTAGTLISDVSFRNFEIDCTPAKFSAYSTTNKAIYLRPVDRLRVQDMFIHDSSATAIGCDFLRDSFILNNVVQWPAVQYQELSASAGGAGIGIGTGRYTQESVLIEGNSVFNAGNKGIFAESQSSTVRSRGVRAVNNYVFGSKVGVGDYACDSMVIANNTIDFCQYGVSVEHGFVTSLYSENSLIRGNTLRMSGIDVIQKTGSITIEGNVLDGSWVTGGTIVVTPATSATLETVRIIGNSIRQTTGRGIQVASGGTSWNRAIVTGNTVVDCGSGSARAAIYSTATINVLIVKDNFAFDTRAGGSRYQSYGLELASGAITRLIYDGNDFADNLTGTELLTVTPGTTVTHFNP